MKILKIMETVIAVLAVGFCTLCAWSGIVGDHNYVDLTNATGMIFMVIRYLLIDLVVRNVYSYVKARKESKLNIVEERA